MLAKLKVLLVSSEVVPLSKTGGLADVAGALPKALVELGCDVRVATPLYSMTRKGGVKSEMLASDIPVAIGTRGLKGTVQETLLEETLRVYLVEKDEFYDRSQLYGTPRGDYDDNAERFIFLSRILLPLCKAAGFIPDVIHSHDWQTGLVPAFLKLLWRQDEQFRRTASVFTIHNLAYQGIFPAEVFPLTGLPGEAFTMQGLEYWGKVNFMKAGIVYADTVNTVSRKYSKEIQTPQYGQGLEGVLTARSGDLHGILNGVDYSQWDPASDKLIAANYSAGNLAGKRRSKEDLLKTMQMDPAIVNAPLVGIVSRLADQKGLDLVAAIMDDMMKMNLGFVLLGTGQEKYEKLFQEVGRKYRSRTGIRIGYDNVLAHKIEAGADIFAMPSQYEPCGLNQMYSLRYGTIPVVRATGGLDDTVTEFNPVSGKGNGFKFKGSSPAAFLAAIRKAVSVYADSARWTRLMKNGMKADFSWRRSAKAYVELYHKALAKVMDA